MKTALLTLTMGLCFVGLLGAQSTIYVDAAAAPGGNGSLGMPFQTIPPAITAAVSGDTIIVFPGTYGGVMDFQNKAVTLQSLLGKSVTFMEANAVLGNGQVLATGTGTAFLRIIGFTVKEASGMNMELKFDGSSVELNDCDFTIDVIEHVNPLVALTVDNCLLDTTHLLHTLMGNPTIIGNVVIKNSEFKNQAFSSSGYPLAAIKLSASQVTVDNCYVHDSIRPFLFCRRNVLIKDSTFAFIAAVLSDSIYPGFNWEIKDSTLLGVVKPIDATSGSYTLASSLLVKDVSTSQCGSWKLNAQTARFEHCELLDTTAAYSTIVPTVGSLEVIDTKIRNCAAPTLIYGSNVTYSLTMRGCSVSDCSGTIGSTGPMSVEYCSFWNNTPAFNVLLTTPFGAEVQNSVFTSGSGAYADSSARMDFCNVQGGWAGFGSNNIDVPALFVDPINGDFHLQSNSLMIDAGSEATFDPTELDFEGDARRIGRFSDIGADEFNSGTFALRGTDEDFSMICSVNLNRVKGAGVSVAGGDLVSLDTQSPLGNFVGSPVYVLGEAFSNGGSPILPFGHPQVYVNLANVDVLFDPYLAYGSAIWGFGLPSNGLYLSGTVPFGFSGVTYRIQAFAVWPNAANGWYAASDAVDLVHP